jgi:hypothetical protein
MTGLRSRSEQTLDELRKYAIDLESTPVHGAVALLGAVADVEGGFTADRPNRPNLPDWPNWSNWRNVNPFWVVRASSCRALSRRAVACARRHIRRRYAPM